jgi:hypothetical protein
MQAVDHPYLVVHSATAPPTSAGQEKEAALSEMCGICHDPVEDAVVSHSPLMRNYKDFLWCTFSCLTSVLESGHASASE